MSLFGKSNKALDTNAWQRALTGGTYDEFLAIYDPAFVNVDLGRSPLLLALSNTDPAARVAIASLLLGDGASVMNGHPLQTLLAQVKHDAASEAPLLQRLIDAGCSVNDRLDDGRTPLEQIASNFKFSDDDLAPFYDVLLGAPDIALMQPGLDDRPVLDNLRKWYALRAELVERAKELLTNQGVTVPEGEN